MEDIRAELPRSCDPLSVSIERAAMSGWGRKSSGSTKNVNVLHHINLTIYDQVKCNEDWEKRLKSENKSRDIDMTKVLCARHTDKVKTKAIRKLTSCNGDSGGAVTCKDGVGFLCGIVSGADVHCGEKEIISGISTNVLSYFDWITDNYNQLELRYNCPCKYFRCINEFCVNPSSLNNGIDDCEDGSDEEEGIRELFQNTSHNYKNWDVEETKYKCHYTLHHPERYRLISTEYLCDGILNCPANHPSICSNYTNNLSLCGNPTQMGTPDPSKFNNCIHRTDETNCQDCKNGSIKCPNETKCIRPKYLCNGIRNCNDGSDEMNCDSCSNPNSNFHCPSNRTCINIQQRCDGKRDCAKGEDEENCNSCKSTAFFCSQEKKCIPENYRCDAMRNDCDGNLDELNCTECVDNRFLCTQDQKCIFKQFHCNGVPDCSDHSDEKDCKLCRNYSFRCKSEEKCILLSMRCDGKQDCRNNEDEKNCYRCAESLFYCAKSRRCIEENLRCDGKKDCEYNEDEDRPCPATTTAGSSNEFANYY